jgi:hypothetical protein
VLKLSDPRTLPPSPRNPLRLERSHGRLTRLSTAAVVPDGRDKLNRPEPRLPRGRMYHLVNRPSLLALLRHRSELAGSALACDFVASKTTAVEIRCLGETQLAVPTSIPSLSNSPLMRGASRNAFARCRSAQWSGRSVRRSGWQPLGTKLTCEQRSWLRRGFASAQFEKRCYGERPVLVPLR